VALLAEQLSASVTPVRDALNTLTGEGLVEPPGGGFHLPPLDEPGLRDMFAGKHRSCASH
jgi:DNA-binding GntR family transcriptional regulator